MYIIHASYMYMMLQVPYFLTSLACVVHTCTCILVLKSMYIYVLSHLGERK